MGKTRLQYFNHGERYEHFEWGRCTHRDGKKTLYILKFFSYLVGKHTYTNMKFIERGIRKESTKSFSYVVHKHQKKRVLFEKPFLCKK